jgi:AcrR family transcriptional regulator
VIDQKGFNAAGMREIAAAADMPVSSLYQYVRSKDDLLTLIFDSYLDETVEKVREAAAKSHDSAAARLRSAIATNLKSFDRYRRQIRLMNRETVSLGPVARRRVFDHMRTYIGLFSELVADGTRNREFRKVDPELFANLILMLCEVWPLRAWALKNFSLDQVRDGISDLILSGLAARKQSDGRADAP